MNTLTIHHASPQDWRTIQNLNNQVFQSEISNDPHLNLNWPQSPEGEKYYQDLCQNHADYYTIIAYLGDQAVGYLTASPRIEDYRNNKPLEINNMGTDPNYRSKGVGTALVDHLKIYAKQAGYTHLYVNAYAKNTRAHQFYQKQGLTPIDISFEGEL